MYLVEVVVAILLCTLQSVDCLCFSNGTNSSLEQCSTIVVTPYTEFVIIKPQLTLVTGCRNIIADAYVLHGNGKLNVEFNTSEAKIYLPPNPDQRPNKYLFDLMYSLATDKDSCSNNEVANALLKQTIQVSIVGPPILQLESTSPHTFKCSPDTDITTVWIRFERQGIVLGYCGPDAHEQRLVGGYILYRPTTDKRACTLQITGKENGGIYTCSTQYEGIDDVFISTAANITTKHNDKLVYGLIGGISALGFILIVLVLLFIGAILYHWRYRPRPRPPAEQRNDDQNGPNDENPN